LRSAQVQAQAPSGATTAGEKLLAGYRVRYDGRVVSNNQTTFTYTVSGTGVQPSLSHFVIGIPTCAPALVSSIPASGSAVIGLDPATGVSGITWGNVSVGVNESRTYSITFPGDVVEGLVRVAVKSGDAVGVGVLPGPCGGFTVSGTVYVDADADAVRDLNESGTFEGVTVALVDPSGVVQTTATDAGGHYSFRTLDGVYTVRIDAATPTSDFNEHLASDFTATGATSRSVTLGPDATLDFGYNPQTQKLITDFSAGALVSTGENASYWTRVLRATSKGQSLNGFTPASMKALLIQIEGQFLPEPYQFTDGKEIVEALAIVSGRPRDDLETLRRELLIAELNDAGGKGIVSNPELQDALLAWGESLVAGAVPASASVSIESVQPPSSGTVSGAINLFRLVNNSRGGGDIPE
jgi:hypothetical protein